jgi:hypothetical protein
MILFLHQIFNFLNFILTISFSVYISLNLHYQACFEFWEELNDKLFFDFEKLESIGSEN